MPAIFSIDSECSLCGTISTQEQAAATSTKGLPDLDTRPAEPVRSLLPYRVQYCPNCGYCATDISLDYPGAVGVIRSEAYQKLLRRRSLPEKARQFLAWALIEEAGGEPGGAGWSALHAAWVCDDAEKPAAASECRRLALARFTRQRALIGHIPGFEDASLEDLMLADLNRRIGHFKEAQICARAGLDHQPVEVVRRTLNLEIELADRGDRSVHSLEEIE